MLDEISINIVMFDLSSQISIGKFIQELEMQGFTITPLGGILFRVVACIILRC